MRFFEGGLISQPRAFSFNIMIRLETHNVIYHLGSLAIEMQRYSFNGEWRME